MSINKVVQTGRMVRDPELRYSQNGVAMTTFSYAVDDGFGDRKKTFFFSGVAWRATAEFIANYARKGDLFTIEGKLTERSWEKDGEKKYRTEISVDDFVLMSKKRDAVASESAGVVPANNDFVEVTDDDLPFN